MPVLLVDDRNGRILAELQSADEAVRALAAMTSEDASVPAYLCLVECRSNHGSLLGADTGVTIRTLR